jgi:putative phosphonate metabolism protein
MRYAIYFTPPQDDPLTVAASNWLGRDAFSGETKAHPPTEGFDTTEISMLTEEPRRYGFHATLKAPFELSPETSEDELFVAFEDFSLETTAFTIPDVVIGRLGNFFAFVPGGWVPALHLLADDCVSRFERFRAPLDPDDIARRKPDSLSASQRQNLLTWGYPYVFDEFRFHMTLTGPVPKEQHGFMQTALGKRFANFSGQPLPVTEIALFAEAERGAPFIVKKTMPLRGEKARKTA